MCNALYVPNLACNLFSVRATTAKGNAVKFGETKCWIRSRKSILLGMGHLETNTTISTVEQPLRIKLQMHLNVRQEAQKLTSGINVWDI